MKQITVTVPDHVSEHEAQDGIDRLYGDDWMAVWWHMLDVQERADEMGIEISDEQAREILHTAKKYHDSFTGINWDVWSAYIENTVI